MKNTLIKISYSTAITVFFFLSMNWIGGFYFRNYSVIPTFPYYDSLLYYVSDAAHAIWGYFDGVHYLRLIEHGYIDIGTQAFFPFYPLLASILSNFTGLSAYASAILVSLVSFILSLPILWQLYPSHKVRSTIFLLLFPTSFFFLSVYTESLFLLLSLSFFLLLKNHRYLAASLLAGLASATRLVGVFLGLILVWHLITQHKKTSIFYIVVLATLSLSGFIGYCLFLWLQHNDPLMFLHVQGMFGANRTQGEIILLPQVIYRYIKMIVTVDLTTYLYQRIWLELVFFTGALYAWAKNLKHQSNEINLYVILSLLLPTLTGTLSSVPRYILVLVPFILPKNIYITNFLILSTLSFLLLLYIFAFFAHGNFVA